MLKYMVEADLADDFLMIITICNSVMKIEKNDVNISFNNYQLSKINSIIMSYVLMKKTK